MALPMPRLPPVMTATLSVRSRSGSIRLVYRAAALRRELSFVSGPIGPETKDRTTSIEVRRQPEQREQAVGVEERVDPDDLAVAGLEDHQRPRVVAGAVGSGPVLT